MVQPEDRLSAVTTFARWGATALGALGSTATIAYVAGYLNRWSYFKTDGAPWLGRELTAAEILVASFDGLLPLVLLVGVALVQSAEREHAERRMQRNLFAWVVLAVILVGLDRRGATAFVEEARGLFSLAASFAVIFAAVAATKLGIVHLAEDRRYFGGIRAAHALLAVAVAGFVFAPILAGRADALTVRGSHFAALPRATFTISASTEQLPVLLVAADHVYCIRQASAGYVVAPVPWSQVQAITTTPEP